MKFNSQICTSREQSERLLSLGLKKETADINLLRIYGEKDLARIGVPEIWTKRFLDAYVPAWSIWCLGMLIPRYIEIEKGNEYEIVTTHGYFKVINDLGDVYKYFDNNNSVYDNIINCIEWLIKEGHFNKEYLVNQAEIEEHCKGVLEYLDYIRGEEE